MASKNRKTLKTFFQTGKIPNQEQYADLIDSQLNLTDTDNQTISSGLTINNAVTIGSTLEANSINTGLGDFEVGQNTRTTDSVIFSSMFVSGSVGNITASGDISSSGDIMITNVTSSGNISSSGDIMITNVTSSGNISSSGDIMITNVTSSGNISSSGDIMITNVTSSGNISSSGDIIINNITASGNISGSSISTGSFGELGIAGNAIVDGDLFVSRYIRHTGDIDTHIEFLDNKIQLHAGNLPFITIDKDSSAPYPLTINNGGNRINFRVLDRNADLLLKADSEAHKVNLYHAGSQKLETTADGINITGHITASSNLKIDGSQVDFTNLPTSDPGVSGRLYNDNGSLKISAG